MTIAFLLIFTCCLAQCVCRTSTSNCAFTYLNTCTGNLQCDVIEVSGANFNLTKECIDTVNKGKVPLVKISSTCTFYLESNIFKKEGGLTIGPYLVTLSGFNNFELFNSFEMTHDNTILKIDDKYEMKDTNFTVSVGKIYFLKETSFINSQFTYNSYELKFEGNSLTLDNSSLIAPNLGNTLNSAISCPEVKFINSNVDLGGKITISSAETSNFTVIDSFLTVKTTLQQNIYSDLINITNSTCYFSSTTGLNFGDDQKTDIYFVDSNITFMVVNTINYLNIYGKILNSKNTIISMTSNNYATNFGSINQNITLENSQIYFLSSATLNFRGIDFNCYYSTITSSSVAFYFQQTNLINLIGSLLEVNVVYFLKVSPTLVDTTIRVVTGSITYQKELTFSNSTLNLVGSKITSYYSHNNVLFINNSKLECSGESVINVAASKLLYFTDSTIQISGKPTQTQSYSTTGLYVGDGNTVIINDGASVQFNTLTLEDNQYFIGQNVDIVVKDLNVIDTHFDSETSQKISTTNTHYILKENMESNNIFFSKVVTTTHISLFDNSKLNVKDIDFKTVKQIQTFDSSSFNLENVTLSLTNLNTYNESVVSIKDTQIITITNLNVYNGSVVSFTEPQTITITNLNIHNESVVSIKDTQLLTINNLKCYNHSSVILSNNKKTVFTKIYLFGSSSFVGEYCEEIISESLFMIEESKTNMSYVNSFSLSKRDSTIKGSSSILLFNSSLLLLPAPSYPVVFIKFEGESQLIYNNLKFLTDKETIEFYDNATIIFKGINTKETDFGRILLKGSNRMIFEDNCQIIGKPIYVESNENTKMEFGEQTFVYFYKIHLANNLNNISICNTCEIKTDELYLTNIIERTDLLNYFIPKTLFLKGNTQQILERNILIDKIDMNGYSTLSIKNIEIVFNFLFIAQQSSFSVYDSLLEIDYVFIDVSPTANPPEFHLSLIGNSNMNVNKVRINNAQTRVLIDSESQLFLNQVYNYFNGMNVDLKSKKRTKQVLDVGFSGNIQHIKWNNVPEQCFDAIHSSTRLSFSPPTNHKLLSNNRLLRICPPSITFKNDVHCELNGSIWNTTFQQNAFSFETRNCPCNNEGITECTFIPNVNELETPYSTELIKFEDILNDLYFQSSSNTRTFIGTFKNVIMTSQLKIILPSNLVTLKGYDSFDPYATVICQMYLNYYINRPNEIKMATLDFNEMNVIESTKIYVDFTIINVDYDQEIKYAPTQSTLASIKYGYMFTTYKGYTVNILNNYTSIYIYKNGFIDGQTFKSCDVLLRNVTGGSVCVANETNWCSVGKYYDNKTSSCLNCDLNCERCIDSTFCFCCKDKFILTLEGGCVELIDRCHYENGGKCVLCEYGYYYNGSECTNCVEHCEYCGSFEKCIICESNYINFDGICIKPEHSIITNNNTILKCENGYFLNESKECQICLIDGCEICQNQNTCLKCKETFVFDRNGICVSTECEIGNVKNEGGECVKEIEHCLKYFSDECVDCEENYYVSFGVCEKNNIQNCNKYSTSFGCLSCANHTYLSNGICTECSDNCKTCLNSSEYCLSCYDGTFLNTDTRICDLKEEMKSKCEFLSDLGGCIKCKEEYFRFGLNCLKCIDKCSICQDNTTCLICKSDYFMNYENECELKSNIIGCSVEISTTEGCTKCNDTYYLHHKECYECGSNCKTCKEKSDYCLSCTDDKVLINNKCSGLNEILECTKIENSQCTKCSFWNSPNENKTGCIKKAEWWFILIFVLIFIIFFGLIFFGIYKVINQLLKRRHRKEQEKTICVFEIERSNVIFKNKICEGVYSNVSKIDFNEDESEIPVGQETKSLICIGNKGKTKKKIQITLKDGCDKYSIRTNPQVITLKKGEACEFEIFITPLCTSEFVDNLNIVMLDMKKSETLINQMKISVITQLSTKLDYTELKENKKLGEGSFGIVYLGTFRGNKVAIKKMKESNEDKMKEFSDEVAMLDKFRSEYIIHFYGAVFIPNKICMVTEFAQFGSLQDLMNNQNETNVTMKLRIKMMIDSAKGIQYLHSNGILHRDIKPDNILVVSLDDNEQVNAKLTDFGASRNINMLMTNMTFTKGIGSPIYMAPEVLKKEKYKMPSDVYSFAITMYECFGWCECYPKTIFKFPWLIAEFVIDGKRRPKPDNMTNEQYHLIDQCWKHEPKERIKIEDVVKQLQIL